MIGNLLTLLTTAAILVVGGLALLPPPERRVPVRVQEQDPREAPEADESES